MIQSYKHRDENRKPEEVFLLNAIEQITTGPDFTATMSVDRKSLKTSRSSTISDTTYVKFQFKDA